MTPKTLEILAFASILALAALLRLGYTLESSAGPWFDQPISDSAFNDHMARALSGHPVREGREAVEHELATMPFIKAPGYPLLLAGVYALFGPGPVAPRFLQFLLGLTSITLLYLLARRLAGWIAALWAILLFAPYWLFIYYEGLLHAPTLTTTLILLFLVLTERWWNSFSLRRIFFLALLAGCLILIRKNAAVFLLVLFLYFLWQHRAQGIKFVSSYTATTGLALALVLLPIGFWNLHRSGEWVFISCDAGRNLYMGNNQESDGLSPVLPEQRILTGEEGWNIFAYPELVKGLERSAGVKWTATNTEKFFGKRALKWIGAHPIDALLLTAKKAYFFWSPHEISSDQVVSLDRETSSLLRWLPAPFSLILTLALGGAMLLWKRRKENLPQGYVLVGLTIGFYFLSFLPGLPESRYRTALIPLLCLFAGVCLEYVGRRAVDRQWKPALVMSGSLAALFILLNTAWIPYTPDQAKWAYERAVQYDRSGNPEQARDYYQQALKARPTFVEAYHNLGILLSRDQETQPTAEATIRRALDLKPDYFPARHSLATLYLQQKKTGEALALAEETMALFTGDYRAYYLAGLIVLGSGHYEASVDYFQRALALNPAHAESHNNLGVAYLRLQQKDNAKKHFTEALHLRPGYTVARENLALLQQGPQGP